MSALSFILLAYVIVIASVLGAINSMDARDRRKHYYALQAAQQKFAVGYERQREDMEQQMLSLPFPIRLYAEDDSARRWLKKAAERLNFPRKVQRKSKRQSE